MAETCFNLADALESNYKPDSLEVDCSPMYKTSDHYAECHLHSGIELEVSEHPQNMRHVVNLVIALHRMKKIQKVRSTEFTDEELCSILFENLVEEYVTLTSHEETYQAADNYSRNTAVHKCYICDTLQKHLVLCEGVTTELQAITLQGINMNRRVQLELSTYTSSVPREQGQPIALSVGNDLYISCTSNAGRPVLGLERVNKVDLENISGDMKRFLFFKTVNNQSLTSFESAKYEGYYISTSYSNRERVDVCKAQDAPGRVTTFRLV